MRTRLAAIAGVLLLFGAALWFFVVQPGQEADAVRAEEALTAGIALYNDKKYEAALEVLQRVPSGTTPEAKARYYEGSAYMMLKDYESAARQLEQALALDPNDVGSMYGLGVAYFKLGNAKLSKSYFSAVLEINPNDEHAKGLMDIVAEMERRTETDK